MWAELSPRFPRDLGRALNPFPHAQEDLQGSPTIASAIATRCGRPSSAWGRGWAAVHPQQLLLLLLPLKLNVLPGELYDGCLPSKQVTSPTVCVCRNSCQKCFCAQVLGLGCPAGSRILLCQCCWTVGLSTVVTRRVLGRLMGSADLFAARWEEGLPGSLAAGRAPSCGLNTIVQRQQTFQEAVDLLSHPDAPRSEKSALGKTMLTLALLSQVLSLLMPGRHAP